MAAQRSETSPPTPLQVDWEAFYRNYRKPGYLAGFEIQNKLGGGMFGLVFKARKESIGKDYAVKFLKVDDDTVRDAVMREIDNVSYFAQIDHPNLVSIEDKGSIDGIPYLVMSYAGEDTLQKRLQAGVTRDEVLRIFVQAARGVQALHDHSLVHFDLKPANIFLKGDVARVGDYGLSKLVSVSRNSLSFGRGTPYYMAPEMLQRRGDARSDIYSLGVILFECLYGDVPFRGDSEWEVLRKHEQAPLAFPDGALAHDRAILERCMHKRPEDRFASVAELLRALQAPVALGESFVLRAASLPFASAVDASSPGAAAPTIARDPADSPYAMPWRGGDGSRSILAGVVHAMFAAIRGILWLTLLPVKAISTFAGRGVLFLLRLPIRIVGVFARLVGLLLILGLVVLAFVTLMHLLIAV
jgi:eukaryotic-like serine/threonine-protein kinase